MCLKNNTSGVVEIPVMGLSDCCPLLKEIYYTLRICTCILCIIKDKLLCKIAAAVFPGSMFQDCIAKSWLFAFARTWNSFGDVQRKAQLTFPS